MPPVTAVWPALSLLAVLSAAEVDSGSRGAQEQADEHGRLGGALVEAAPAAPQRFHVRLESDRLLLCDEEGAPIVNLIPLLLVSYSGERLAPTAAATLPAPRVIPFSLLQTEQDVDGSWIVRTMASIPGVDYLLTVSHRALRPTLDVTLEVQYKTDLLVHFEIVRFVASNVTRGVMPDRAYRPRAIDQHLLADPLSPRLATLEVGAQRLSLVAGAGVQSLHAWPGGPGTLLLDLELDHQLNHPFPVYHDCRVVSSPAPPRLHLDESWRRPGERRVGRGAWVIGPLTPIMVGRFPRGLQAALIFADHADQSDAAKLEAFAFGRTGALAAGEVGPGHPGFVNRGLSYTKTVFIARPESRRGRMQFDDVAFRTVLDEMARRGVEIGVHSPSPVRDRPERALGMLRSFRQSYTGRTWIDHQPDTNCEAIANQGWNPYSPWFMLDNLAATGFRYVAYMADLPLATGVLNLLAPHLPGARRPVLYEHSRLRSTAGDRFVVFTSTWLYVGRQRFARWFNDEALDRLEAERGINIGHVYFDTYKSSGPARERGLIEPDERGGFRVMPLIDEVFLSLARRQAEGRLWVAGVEAVAAHLLPAMAVEVDYRDDGRAELRLPAGQALAGLTVLLPARQQRLLVDGRPVAQRYASGELLEAWFDAPDQRALVLEQHDIDGRLIPFTGPAALALLLPSGDERSPESGGEHARAPW